METVGIDSIAYTRRSADGSEFKAPLGVAVSIRNRNKFRKKYDDCLDELFDKYRENKRKNVYKAAHLTYQLKHKTNEFIREFIKEMSSEFQRIDFFYTFFPPGVIDKINVCRDSYHRTVDLDTYMKIVEKGYEHYCVWKYCKEYPLSSNNLFEVDHFSAKITPAWDQIEDLESLSIFYSGGECNKAISMADIILRHVQNTCSGRLMHPSLVDSIGPYLEDVLVKSWWMGYRRDYLNNMAWRDDFDIDLKNNIQHPIFWIAWNKYTSRSEEKVTLEWMENYNQIMTKAEDNFASVRFWEPRQFPMEVNIDTDLVFLLNDNAVPILRSIKDACPGIKTMDYRPGVLM